jgi:acyl carrier protein
MAGQATMDRLNEVFCRVFDDPNLRILETMTAHDVDGWDSLTHINLIVAAERAFGIKFTTKEVLTFKNVGDFAAAIERKQAPPQT